MTNKVVTSLHNTFSNIEDIIEDVRNGKMVIMVDDEDRENEGDLIMAAEKVLSLIHISEPTRPLYLSYAVVGGE